MKKIYLNDIIKYTHGTVIGSGNAEEIFIDSISSNSKEIKENSMFVAIPGERVNGHDFVSGAFAAGASVALISEKSAAEKIPEGKVCILTDNTINALQSLAAWYRSLFNIPVVAVTGSVGKTTTKEMISAALSSGLRVLKTKGNMNSQLGVALMMFEINEDTDIAVIEMGISEHGEMIRLTETAKPETAVVTNIGVSHIGNLGSRENIRHEKLDVVKGFPAENNLLLVPGNDDYLCSYEKLDNEGMSSVKNVIWYGEEDFCRYKAKNIHNENDHAIFELYIDNRFIMEVNLSVMGIHNVYNALAAVAVADRYSLDINNAVMKLSEYRPLAMRGQIHKNSKNITIIDDTYNASPDSMRSGLGVLWDKECKGRRIAVLADVLELGEHSSELHRSVGRYILEKSSAGYKTDLLITVGHEAAYIADEVKRIAGSCGDVRSYKSRDEAFEYLKEYLLPGDLVMVKGSRGMQMDKIVDALKEL